MNLETMQRIYRHIGDDRSREVFYARVMLSITNRDEWVHKLVHSNFELNDFFIRLYNESNNLKKIVVMGCGYRGKQLVRTYRDVKWQVFIDNDPKDSICEGIPVRKTEEFLKKYNQEIIVISSRVYEKQMREQLLHAGIPEEQILNYGGILEMQMSNQYFDLPNFPLEEEEIFVDLGCFDGRSDEELKKKIGDKLKYIVAFEPDLNRVSICNKKLTKLGVDYELIEKGCWSKEAILRFRISDNGLVTLTEDGEGEKVEVITVDQILNGRKATFLKMDIEGSELEALKGSKKTIQAYKPKLAICVYHKNEDIFEIPAFILECCSEYKFYLRHYSPIGTETVLYAIPE